MRVFRHGHQIHHMKTFRRRHVLTPLQLQTLTTSRLKAYFHKVMSCHDTCHWDDNPKEPVNPLDEVTKDSQVWKDLYQHVKIEFRERDKVERAINLE